LSKEQLIILLIVIAVSIAILTSVLFVTSSYTELGPFFSNWVSNTTAASAVTMAIISTLKAFKLHQSRNSSNPNTRYYQITDCTTRQYFYGILSLTIGLVLWCIAELMWTYYQLVVGIANPFPSVADAFWLSGYPFLLYFVLGMNKAIAKNGVYDREALVLVSASAGLALAHTFTLMFGIEDLIPSTQDNLG
jgi:hypothetical protein